MAADAASPVLVLATRSEDKAREIRQILAPVFRGTILSLDDAGIAADAAEEGIEVFDTFLDNAHAKAAYFMERAGLPVLADDSGIVVDALGGAPGVRSRRYAAERGIEGGELDRANNLRLLRELHDVPHSRRTARYVCAAVIHLANGRRCGVLATRSGIILPDMRGTGGFGYDPIFLDPQTGLSFGETDPVAKNRTSHRARAFRGLAANLPY